MNLRDVSRLLYQIKLADQQVASSFEKKTGFSLTRYELLMTLRELGKCSQSAIQQELKIDHAAVTRHLKILEEKGYVRRERNQANNREVFVQLTEKAEKELSRCEQEHQASAQLLYPALSDQEIRQLSELLSKLIDNKS